MRFQPFGFRRLKLSDPAIVVLTVAACALGSSNTLAQTPLESLDSSEREQSTAVVSEGAMQDSFLSLQGIVQLADEASDAVLVEDYDLALRKLQDARELSNQLSNFYQQLSTVFSGIDNRIYEQQRRMALEAAQLRDTTTYRLALLHRAQNQPELAVPLFVQIVGSQNPTRELGNQAYRQLYELGFVRSSFEIERDSEPEGPEAEDSSEAEPVSEAEDLSEASETEEDASAQSNPMATLGEDTILSVKGVEGLMEDAQEAVLSEDYDRAIQVLQEAREISNRLSNYYQQLAGSFSGIENRIYEEQRRLALESAQLRDEATYQLALLHRARNQPELAVPLLVQILGSQNPTRDLGKNAYRQLYELGFVNDPYPRDRDR
ncbi:MAG: hypothetical protein J7642_16125 [Cyanobacteria bacterium SBC]|nr:hypothetical protein [Cyanobacteria bacterium SBC]